MFKFLNFHWKMCMYTTTKWTWWLICYSHVLLGGWRLFPGSSRLLYGNQSGLELEKGYWECMSRGSCQCSSIRHSDQFPQKRPTRSHLLHLTSGSSPILAMNKSRSIFDPNHQLQHLLRCNRLNLLVLSD